MLPTGALNYRSQADGFTLLELLVSAVLIAILGVISISTYQRRVEREQLTQAGRELSDWLDEARSEAVKAMAPCNVLISTSNPLQAKAEITTGSPACQSQRTLNLGTGLGNIQVALVAPSSGTLIFSPRGSVTNDLELTLTHVRAGQRCLRISQPLGLIRLGNAQQGQCRYDRPY